MTNWFLYKHYLDDPTKPFYIGIGCLANRPSSVLHRSPLWHNIVNKHGFNYQTVYNQLSKKQAHCFERFWIAVYGRRDLKTGILCNLTDGGDGAPELNKESKEKIREAARVNTKQQWIEGKRQPHYGSQAMLGRLGVECNTTKYTTVATDSRGETRFYTGNQALVEAGYDPSKVAMCCLGKRKTHKGTAFCRIPHEQT